MKKSKTETPAAAAEDPLTAPVPKDPVATAIVFLELHYQAFYQVEPYATEHLHPVPMDTRGWSQVLVSILSTVGGLGRKKGADLSDGSDVKGANTWLAIDTPRFNGVIKAGTKAAKSGTISSLDGMPHLYLVLWDVSPRENPRCRIWVVRPKNDATFRKICGDWYDQVAAGSIKSTNFQLHPPRGNDSNVITNTCGNLSYPLYFAAERDPEKGFVVTHFDPKTRDEGQCSVATEVTRRKSPDRRR